MTLRVTLEILPFGNIDNARTIGILDISNMAKKTKAGQTHYQAVYYPAEPWEKPLAEWSFKHKREDGALECVLRALVRQRGRLGVL